MKRSKLYRLVPQKDLQRLDSAICNLMELAAKILGPEHARTRGRRRLPMEPYWWPEQETPIKPDTDLIELF